MAKHKFGCLIGLPNERMGNNLPDEQQGEKTARAGIATESHISALSCPFREQSQFRHIIISVITP
jgi:hypothetical protein